MKVGHLCSLCAGDCPDSRWPCYYKVFNLATGIIHEMRVKQTRAVNYYFIRYPVIMDKKKTTTEGDTGVLLGLRKSAHCSLECAFTAVLTGRKADTCNSYGKPFVGRLQSWNFG